MPDSEIREQARDSVDPFQIVLVSMTEAETKAWEALAGYKFWMFGYHAARWVNYNQLLPSHRRFRSPFKILVGIGRERADTIQDALPQAEIRNPQMSLLPGKAES